jgi:hypothetical protein
MLAVMQRVRATLSIYQPDAFMFLSISRLHGKPCIKSATALPIQQSKAIADYSPRKRVCRVWSARKRAPARTSQSIHAPHPAHQRCLSDTMVYPIGEPIDCR